MRGLLMAFQPVELGWFGQGEMRTLAKVEWVGRQPLLQAQALLLGYYMNELLLKLLPREDGLTLELYELDNCVYRPKGQKSWTVIEDEGKPFRPEKQERTDQEIHGHGRIARFHFGHSRLAGSEAFSELDL